MAAGATPHKVRIWDLPTRLFHWCLVVCALALLITAKVGGDAMVWHARLGFCTAALLLFRLSWGWLGGYWSRFANFPPAPLAAWRHVRGAGAGGSGHNPLGALSVYAMLLFLVAQVATGLFSENKDDFSGPLAVHVSNATVHLMTAYHQNVGQWILVALVLLHIGAVLYTLVRRKDNLIRPMITGDKELAQAGPESRDTIGTRLLALALLAVWAAAVAWLVSLGG